MLALPYSVDRKLTAVPYVAYVLAGVNVLVYLASVLMGPEAYRGFVFWGGVVAADVKWHALLTMHFIHDAPSPLHLGGNLLFLLLFGRHVEDAIGRVWFALLYVLGGVAAAMIQTAATVLLSPSGAHVPMIGASGAIAALLGVFAVRFYRTKVRVFWILGIGLFLNRAGVWRVSSLIALGLWGAWELVQGVFELGTAEVQQAGGVAHWAHLGGLAFGVVIALGAGLHRQAHESYTLKDAYDLFRNGDMRKSADCFAQLIREAPDDPDMHHKLAVAHEHSYHRARAMPHYLKAVELYAGLGNTMDAARIYAKTNREPWVARHLDPDVFWLVADHLAERGAVQEAVAAFASLAVSQPGRPQAETAAVRCGDILLGDLNHPTQAIEWYRTVRDRGKMQENVARAARGIAAAEQALAAGARAARPS